MGCSTSTRRCSATGRSCGPRRRCGRCSRTRWGSSLSPSLPRVALLDWTGLCGRLAAEEALWPSGTAIGESALFYGHLVGEIVRRVDGRDIGTYLREEVCGPADLDFAVGLTSGELGRVVDLTGLDASSRSRWPTRVPPTCSRRALLNPPGAIDAEVVNGSAFRRAQIPAINGHGTARAVAGLYAGLLEGRADLPALRDEAAQPQASGVDRVMGGEPRSWGLGFGVDDDGFGMGGLGGSSGGACPEGGYAYAFVTGTMGTHERSDRVENAFRAVIGLPPL